MIYNSFTTFSGYTFVSRRYFLSTHFRRLHTTGRRLGEGGGYTNVRAGDTLSNLHKCFCGHTPPLAPNRSLAAVHFVRFSLIHFSVSQQIKSDIIRVWLPFLIEFAMLNQYLSNVHI
jgi:hypothetical protein